MGRDVTVGRKPILNASRNSFVNALAVTSHYFDEAVGVANLTNLITTIDTVTVSV